VAGEEVTKKKKEDTLVKKLADKLIATAISNETEAEEEKPAIVKKASKNKKNLIYEDDEENLDLYSTPPKKAIALKESTRTPLSCVANTNTPKRTFASSTPKSTKNFNDENSKSISRIPVSSSRRLH
jgi:hypothetical protein